MNKPKTHKQSKVTSPKLGKQFLIPLIVLISLVGAYIFRGWIRVTILPKTTAVFYGNSVKNTANEEISQLQNPLEALGFTNIEHTPMKCELSRANGIKTQITCSVKWSSYKEISQVTQDKSELNNSAKNIQNLLKQNGWDGEYSEESEYTSLSKLMSSITSGIDYQPDAAYQKVIGKVYCIFDSNTAFSSPSPSAISSYIECSQSFSPFGTPEIDAPLELLPEARG